MFLMNIRNMLLELVILKMLDYMFLCLKFFGDRGCCSKHAATKFLEWADKFNPVVLWLHNIDDYYINIEMLFKWIKNRPNMQVKWIYHDCWYCSYFSHIGCEKWKNECSNC